jgi:hypothetical protein
MLGFPFAAGGAGAVHGWKLREFFGEVLKNQCGTAAIWPI